jgi:hypothetical protein
MASGETVIVPLRLDRDDVERLDEVAAGELRSRSGMAKALVIGSLYGSGYAFQGPLVHSDRPDPSTPQPFGPRRRVEREDEH